MSNIYYEHEKKNGGLFGLGKCGGLMTINLDQDISQELAMLRGIDYARRHPDRDDAIKYAENDVKSTMGVHEYMKKCIVKVIFNDPATIVFWGDGTKTVVKAENEPFDPEKGLAMAIAKYHFGNKGNYYNVFKKWLPEDISDDSYDDSFDPFGAFKKAMKEIERFGK